MMGKYALRLILVVLLCALLGTVVLARAGTPATPSAYLVESGTATGTGYRLAGGTWQVDGNASGPGYSLAMVGRGILQGAGCCCTYLPCLSRDAP
jgi:hypothetical protein